MPEVIAQRLRGLTTDLQGPLSGVWLRIWQRVLPPVPGAVPAGAGGAQA